MPIKKIALIEPHKETAEKLVQWCKEEGYEVSHLDKLEPDSIRPEEFDVLLVNVHPLDIFGLMDKGEINSKVFDSLIRMLSTSPSFSKLYIVLITPPNAVSAMVEGVEAGVDNFITELSDRQFFLEVLKKITARLKPGSEKVRLLDLNLINFFLTLLSSASREDFFRLASIIFNTLVVRRIMPYIGETTISALLARLKATTGKQTEFMKEIKYQDGKIFMDGVDKASKEVSVPLLCSAFRDYIYAFVHLVRTLTSDILIERWDWERK